MKLKCNECGTLLHDQENSFYVWDYDRSLGIKYALKNMLDDLGWSYEEKEGIINPKEYPFDKSKDDLIIGPPLTEKAYNKIKKFVKDKKKFSEFFYSIMSEAFIQQKPSGEIWRCPKCDKILFDNNDWPYEGKEFDFKGLAKSVENLGYKIDDEELGL